jgi:hypothetical protein
MVRVIEERALDSPSKRCRLGGRDGSGVRDKASSSSVVAMLASGRVGSLSPPGPVSTFKVTKFAALTLGPGLATMNSARAAGASRMLLLVTSVPRLAPSCDPVGTPSSATT